jgi:hypothetical protein
VNDENEEINPIAARSLFSQELGRCCTMYREKRFQRCYFELKQKVESLPELLFHLPTVVKVLTDGLFEVAACTPGSLNTNVPKIDRTAEFGIIGDCTRTSAPLMQLLSVLTQEVSEELFPHFHNIMNALMGCMSGEAPEQSGGAFRTLSYVFKSLAEPIIEDISSMKKYYGPLLGHVRSFIRQFAAETFAPLLRRLSVCLYLLVTFPPSRTFRHSCVYLYDLNQCSYAYTCNKYI